MGAICSEQSDPSCFVRSDLVRLLSHKLSHRRCGSGNVFDEDRWQIFGMNVNSIRYLEILCMSKTNSFFSKWGPVNFGVVYEVGHRTLADLAFLWWGKPVKGA